MQECFGLLLIRGDTPHLVGSEQALTILQGVKREMRQHDSVLEAPLSRKPIFSSWDFEGLFGGCLATEVSLCYVLHSTYTLISNLTLLLWLGRCWKSLLILLVQNVIFTIHLQVALIIRGGSVLGTSANSNPQIWAFESDQLRFHWPPPTL